MPPSTDGSPSQSISFIHIYETHTVSLEIRGTNFEVKPELCCFLALPLYLSNPQCPHPQNGGVTSTHLAGLCCLGRATPLKHSVHVCMLGKCMCVTTGADLCCCPGRGQAEGRVLTVLPPLGLSLGDTDLVLSH